MIVQIFGHAMKSVYGRVAGYMFYILVQKTIPPMSFMNYLPSLIPFPLVLFSRPSNDSTHLYLSTYILRFAKSVFVMFRLATINKIIKRNTQTPET